MWVVVLRKIALMTVLKLGKILHHLSSPVFKPFTYLSDVLHGNLIVCQEIPYFSP